MLSSAWSVDITLPSILFIVQCEMNIAGMFVGYIHSVSHALEAKWRH
jgi:nitrate reductase alpha subunit